MGGNVDNKQVVTKRPYPETEFDIKFTIPSNGMDRDKYYDIVESAVLNTSFADYTTLSATGDGNGSMVFTLNVCIPGGNALVLSKVAGEMAALLPPMRISGVEFYHLEF